MYKYHEETAFEEQNNAHGILASHIPDGARVLEFGCGRGVFAAFLSDKKKCEVTGIEISEEALNSARPHLKQAILCDVETFSWERELGRKKFDVLLFADCLEHLHDPVAVLTRAAKFLAPDGRVLFSLPNLSHADVMAKLLHDRFDYSTTGLLDNTHVHFFAKENVIELVENARLVLTMLDGTVVRAGSTEQAPEGVSRAELRALANRPCGEIYQFLGEARLPEYAEAENLVFADELSKKGSAVCKIYRDFGSGFSEDGISVVSGNDRDEISFEIPAQGISCLRIDPREDVGFFLPAPVFLIDGKPVEPSATEGLVCFGNSYAVSREDPQFLFDFPIGARKFSCSLHISAIPMDDALSAVILPAFTSLGLSLEKAAQYEGEFRRTAENLRLANETFAKETARLTALLDAANNALGEKDEELAEKDKRIAKSETLVNEQQARLLEYDKNFREALRQRDELRAEADAYRAEYEKLVNSSVWKASKPLRAFLDFVKHPLGAPVPEIPSPCPISAERRLIEEANVFSETHLFSILVPLYNTPVPFLCEMIRSALDQTYKNFELVLADGSDDKHPEVGKTVRALAKRDHRIKYKKLKANLGISGNTNACIEMASGDYIVLFDHDDLLHPSALYELMKAITEKGADFIYTDETTFKASVSDAYQPHYKPDYSPDTLRSYNYICHLSAFKKSLLDKVGLFRDAFNGSQDYDMILRLTEQAETIVHIPKILYYWRAHENSVASDISAKPYTLEAARRALAEHLSRVGLSGEVKDSRIPSTYKIDYEIKGAPMISIIIPNKDHADDLDRCVRSIEKKSTYRNFEILVVENNSTEQETFAYYDKIRKEFANLRVLRYEEGFNYAKINNFGAKYARGEYYLLLNNDVEIITPEWIEEMLMFAQRREVGAVGMMLYYPDETVQHAGVILGIGGVAGHSHKYFKRGEYGYASRLSIAQNLSAVTAAAMLVRADAFSAVGGLDEGFAVAFNDVDFCMKLRAAGYLIVFTPYAEAYHYESKSRGLENTPEKVRRFNGEIERFFEKWKPELDAGDPYYNPNLTLVHENFEVAAPDENKQEG